MKKLIFLLLMIAAIACTKDKEIANPTPEKTKCATCTEQETLVEMTFCGLDKNVNIWKRDLISLGAQQGQIWKCNDN